jgi:cation diffusion facilitator CzcD-associated flavoprotein CzcO
VADPWIVRAENSEMSKTDVAYDVVVLGAGVSGLYQLKRCLELDARVIALEGDDDLGGTWYRNRYPGARFDSESYTYGYSFSRELLDEWHWTERFSPQPETLKYLNFVADKFDLRRHIRFHARVREMRWDEAATRWTLHLQSGETITTRYVVTCIGVLSKPTLPKIEGMKDFRGESFHTYWWPKEPVPLAGRRVGVIGAGATAIQLIAEIADKVGSLTVFQRRPNWSTPLHNGPISADEMAAIRKRYDEIFARCAASPGGFEHTPDRRGFRSMSKEQRTELWNHLYEQPGFALLNSNFVEIFTDEEANREMSEFVADKIRQRVKDPAVAEKLIPKDHGFGMQRLPLETNYFEAFNRDNVRLVDLRDTPIRRITPTGIETSGEHIDLDLIIYATGFDAVTGGFDGIDIHGVGGVRLADKWRDGPVTWYGIMSHGFPNMIMVAGPQSVSGSTNFPRAIEVGVDWVTRLLSHVLSRKIARIEAKEAAEQAWFDTVRRSQERLLLRGAKGWFTGYNSNVTGHEEAGKRYIAYWGGAPRYVAQIRSAEEGGYSELEMR